MRIRYLTLIVVLAAGAGACGDSESPAGDTGTTGGNAGSPATEADLEGRTLIATDVTEDGAERPLVEGTELRIDFSEPGMIAVTAGCNSMAGAYTLEEGTLVATDMASTMMACEQALMDQDAWIAELLAEGVEVAVDGDTVTFSGGSTVITAADRETVSPDLSLTGTTWTLDEIRDTDSVSSVGVTATLTIDDDGAYHVETGCNTGNGTATITDSTIDFGPMALTRMACADEGAQEVETAMVTVLDGVVDYQVVESRLTLTTDDAGLGFSGG